ncbi:MAG: glutamate mutase L [Anaerolineae bacterium]
MAEERSGSILAVDFGNVNTRAILVDLVDGMYRLIARAEARSTGGFPASDARLGLNRVIEQMTAVTGRKLLTNDNKIITPEQNDRSGVDYFLTTASIGRTMRTVLVGLVPDVSIASARRALAGTYVDIVELLTLEDGRSEEQQMNAIVSSRPDLIFITGGMEGGAQEGVVQLARVVRLALRLIKGGRKPVLLYAGNSALVSTVREMFDGLASILIAPNIRPSLDDEELEGAQIQLALAYNEQQAKQGGFGPLARMSRLGVLPTAQSYNLMTDYLGKSTGENVLSVDVGSAISILSAHVDDRTSTTIRTDIGLGHSAESLLNLAGEDGVNRWLPFMAAENQIRHYALNKTLVPGSIPETIKGLFIEHGLLRAGIDTLLKVSRPGWTKGMDRSHSLLMPPFGLIIGAGAALTNTGSAGYGTLLLLDAVQPTGTARIVIDPFGMVAALGALALANPEAVVQVLDSSGLEQIGTCISLSGQPKTNRPAMRIKIRTSEGQVIKQHVQGGHLWVYPLGVGRTARVEVSVGRGMSIGGKSKIKFKAEGGAVGLIFDARGRPLPLATDIRGRAAQLPLWISEMTGDPQIEIQDEWLQSARDENQQVDMPEEPAAGRGWFGRRSKEKAVTEQPAEIELRPDLRLPDMPDLDDLRPSRPSKPVKSGKVAAKPEAKAESSLDELRRK